MVDDLHDMPRSIAESARRKLGPSTNQPRMFTILRAAGLGGLLFACGIAISVGLIAALSGGSGAWVAVVVLWVALVLGFVLGVGRYCHPVRQMRFQWGGYRQHAFRDSVEAQRAWIRAWEQTGGKPPARPPGRDAPDGAVPD
jgi:hypothetical protein